MWTGQQLTIDDNDAFLLLTSPTLLSHINSKVMRFIIPDVKILSRDWLTKVGHSIMSTGEMSTGKTSTVLTVSTGSQCCFHGYFTKLGLFGIIKQIFYASVGILMECLPSGGWFSLELRPRENHPPSGRHSIRIPTLAWHICIMTYGVTLTLCCIMWKKQATSCNCNQWVTGDRWVQSKNTYKNNQNCHITLLHHLP